MRTFPLDGQRMMPPANIPADVVNGEIHADRDRQRLHTHQLDRDRQKNPDEHQAHGSRCVRIPS